MRRWTRFARVGSGRWAASAGILLAAGLALGWCSARRIAGAAEPATGYAPVAGQLHRPILLPRIDDGTPISLAQYRGKKVLLIHFASW